MHTWDTLTHAQLHLQGTPRAHAHAHAEQHSGIQGLQALHCGHYAVGYFQHFVAQVVICMARAPLTMQRFLFSTWIFCCCSLEALKNRHGIRLFVIYLWQIAYFKPRSILQFSISLMTDREPTRDRGGRESTSVQLSVAICFLIKRK